ncbi:assimilatory sulfite reductase (NADPH) flavoprotein subunit [Shumkonia mesophila]|uniref:assimilatory sulfite reductase (NADPH) flavoprotein subunit n=1 Tax=Shumkonia mesophila TaxID=2838854 RepID=UPI0029351DC8|nr:assimilatory sulfite reductase (NADPH) flavoprotein subunit [Shumkonia mesophila]
MSTLAAPVIPVTAPFEREQIDLLNRVMADTDAEQRVWLSGFLAGYQAAGRPVETAAPTTVARQPLTILFATESGNAEELAADAKKAAARQGFAATVADMADATPADIAKTRNLLVIASTWGEGSPPERATGFYNALMAEDAPRFEGVRFAVLALGDSAYVNFCETGKRIDARLAELGGERMAERIDCDLDFEAPAAAWIGKALNRLGEPNEAAQAGSGGDVIQLDTRRPAAYSRSHPFEAEVADIVDLNSSRSDKETLHVELSLAGSGLAYEPGDSLGIVPVNDPAMVEAVLKAARIDGGAAVEGVPVGQLLAERYDITTLTRPVIEAYGRLTEDAKLQALAEGADLLPYLEGRQIVDLLEDFPHGLTAEQLVGVLRTLPPRLYSIASSLKAAPDEAHLLISAVRYESHGRARRGVVSTFVADRVAKGDRLKVYVKPNRHFRLPADTGRDVIMIGPGTGVAPFRAFLQERQATGAKGRNWLFFGDRRYVHDFLYQLDWQDFVKEGVLDRIDVAFSRDAAEKVYVQHRLWERRGDVFSWLEGGAHLYVCGDEKHMAKDVHATLKAIVADVGGRSEADAEAYLAGLAKAGRYQRDVY